MGFSEREHLRRNTVREVLSQNAVPGRAALFVQSVFDLFGDGLFESTQPQRQTEREAKCLAQ